MGFEFVFEASIAGLTYASLAFIVAALLFGRRDFV